MNPLYRPPMTPAPSPFVPVVAMQDHVTTGLARPLLDVPDGPVLFGGSWWAIPRSEPDRYTPVEDPKALTVLDDAARRIDQQRAYPTFAG